MVGKEAVSNTRRGRSQLAAEGLTLAQIGAVVCNAAKDAGGDDQDAVRVIDNPAMKRLIGKIVTTPRWDIISSYETLNLMRDEFLNPKSEGERILLRTMFKHTKAFPITEGIEYRLRGIKTDCPLDVLEKMAGESFCLGLTQAPLETALLMRMQIKPGCLGFDWAVIATPFSITGPKENDITVFFPYLSNDGQLGSIKTDEIQDFISKNGVFVYLEEKIGPPQAT